MNIMFLDVDGVLNSERSAHAHGDFGDMYTPSTWNVLDPIAIKLINNVCTLCNIKVVLSSTWRLWADETRLKEFGDFLGLDIIDQTPDSDEGFRGKEIQQWLDNHPEVTNFVIIDDDSDMLESQLPHFVQTSLEVGFNHKNLDDVLKIFKVDSESYIDFIHDNKRKQKEL